MNEILNAALSFPTVIFTALLGCVLLFWLGVIFAGLSHDSLDFHGHADFHQHVDAAWHADFHPVAHVDAHPVVHAGTGHHDGHTPHLDSGGGGWPSGLLGYLNVGAVPVSIIVSAAVVPGWIGAMLLELYARPLLSIALPGFIIGGGILAACGCGSLIAAGLATRPLRGAFKIHTIHGGFALLYKIVTVTTEKVNASFGQAELKMGGAPLILAVRCTGANTLSKGKLAVIVGYDSKARTYEVAEPSPERTEVLRTIERTAEHVEEIVSAGPQALERNDS